MAFLGRCYGCREGNHEEHTGSFDTPPPEAGFVCGGGICNCSICDPRLRHLDTQIIIVKRGKCTCDEVDKENRLGHADGCKYFSNTEYN